MKNTPNKYFRYCLMYFTILQFLNTCFGVIAYYEVASLYKVNTFIGFLFFTMLFAPVILLFSIVKGVQAKTVLKNMKWAIVNYWWRYLGMAAIMLVFSDNGTQNLYAYVAASTAEWDPSNLIFYFSFHISYHMLCDELSFLFFVFVPFICDTIVGMRRKI